MRKFGRKTWTNVTTFETAYRREDNIKMDLNQWRTQEFCSGGGVQQIQLRTERTGIWGR
jgi:hypothetical protein